MPNRRLTPDELTQAHKLLAEVRAKLARLSGADAELLFAYRRKVYKELVYDERSKPALRRRLKQIKREEQKGLCAICGKSLPGSYAVLDRLRAPDGYAPGNTRLIHRECDENQQRDKGFK